MKSQMRLRSPLQAGLDIAPFAVAWTCIPSRSNDRFSVLANLSKCRPLPIPEDPTRYREILRPGSVACNSS
jgi:hypothetical protein